MCLLAFTQSVYLIYEKRVKKWKNMEKKRAMYDWEEDFSTVYKQCVTTAKVRFRLARTLASRERTLSKLETNRFFGGEETISANREHSSDVITISS
jgi:hypothetical protein